MGLRALYGRSDTLNGFHGSDAPATAKRELDLVFEGWNVDWWLEQETKRRQALQ